MKKRNQKKSVETKVGIIQILQAVVVRILNKQAEVWQDGKILKCLLPQALVGERNDLAVGDFVEIGLMEGGQCQLVKILKRKTTLYRGNRRSPGNPILMAANSQVLLAVVPADYIIHQAGYPESAIIAAKRGGIEVGIYISKWDSLSPKAKEVVENKLSLYKSTADFVLTGPDGESHQRLAQRLKGKTTLVVGDRGSGKTTFVKSVLTTLKNESLAPEVPPETHTSILHSGPHQTFIIDTPGFRDFALDQVTEEECQVLFPEICAAAQRCGYNNCTHTHEDDCGVLGAIRTGDLLRERYDAFKKLRGILPAPRLKVKDVDYRRQGCVESFVCKVCGSPIAPEGAGTKHRNHCPNCLSSLHVDNHPGDRASLCGGVMEPVSVWVRKNGEWAIIHRCRLCGTLSANRIAADDNPALLMSMAVKPLAITPFPLDKLGEMFGG